MHRLAYRRTLEALGNENMPRPKMFAKEVAEDIEASIEQCRRVASDLAHGT